MTLQNSHQYFGRDLEAMSFAENYHSWVISEFMPYLRGNVAEVGAGTGNFSRLLLKSNISSLTSFEPSSNMFPLLTANLAKDSRAKAVNEYFSQRNTDELFDTILYVNVLEHIEDDLAELVTVKTALVAGGNLLVFVPAMPWLFGELDRQVGHFRRYTQPGLVDLVRTAGFSVVKVRYFDLLGIIPWYINFVLLKNILSSSNVRLYDRLAVPVMRLIEKLVSPPVGKNLLLVAKKL